jgi:hypothetical protein
MEDMAPPGSVVDQSQPDHFFWFGPGETEYDCRGFYESANEEREFVFGELPNTDESISAADPEFLEKMKKKRRQLACCASNFQWFVFVCV